MNKAAAPPPPTRPASSRAARAGFVALSMAAFGFVRHNLFILFNALIGVAFRRRAQRDLFG